MNLSVIFEDNHIIVVEKPFGIPSQEDLTGDRDLLTMTKDYIKHTYNKPGNVYLGLVHRLDRVTGGVMVFAKTSKAASRLSEEIRSQRMKKYYLAVVEGYLPSKSGVWEDFLYKNKKLNRVTVCSKEKKEAKYACLEYEMLGERDGLSLVLVWLRTGRSHQIRVQFSSRGFVLTGDKKYGSSFPLKGYIGLWSYRIGIDHPILHRELTVSSRPRIHPFDLFEENLDALSLDETYFP